MVRVLSPSRHFTKTVIVSGLLDIYFAFTLILSIMILYHMLVPLKRWYRFWRNRFLFQKETCGWSKKHPYTRKHHNCQDRYHTESTAFCTYHALSLNLSSRRVWWIFDQDLNVHPYKVQVVQVLAHFLFEDDNGTVTTVTWGHYADMIAAFLTSELATSCLKLMRPDCFSKMAWHRILPGRPWMLYDYFFIATSSPGMVTVLRLLGPQTCQHAGT
jgi:hypothetical protein